MNAKTAIFGANKETAKDASAAPWWLAAPDGCCAQCATDTQSSHGEMHPHPHVAKYFYEKALVVPPASSTWCRREENVVQGELASKNQIWYWTWWTTGSREGLSYAHGSNFKYPGNTHIEFTVGQVIIALLLTYLRLFAWIADSSKPLDHSESPIKFLQADLRVWRLAICGHINS